jgi:hypothetical protein
VGAWSLLAIAFATVSALVFIPVAADVPTYALDSVLVFRLERALAIAALLILPALVIAPLLTGALPRRLSSDGIDWGEERATVVETLDAMNQRLSQLEMALSKITELNDE